MQQQQTLGVGFVIIRVLLDQAERDTDSLATAFKPASDRLTLPRRGASGAHGPKGDKRNLHDPRINLKPTTDAMA